jgi:hypothetical protein
VQAEAEHLLQRDGMADEYGWEPMTIVPGRWRLLITRPARLRSDCLTDAVTCQCLLRSFPSNAATDTVRISFQKLNRPRRPWHAGNVRDHQPRSEGHTPPQR